VLQQQQWQLHEFLHDNRPWTSLNVASIPIGLGMNAATHMSHPLQNNPVAIADFLTRAFETNDLELIVAALGTVIRAHNVLAVAEAAGLRREGLYRTFTGSNDPQIGRILKLLAAMDVQLVVKALPPKPKPPRPKRGPPFRTKTGP